MSNPRFQKTRDIIQDSVLLLGDLLLANPEIIGARLAQIRKDKGITQGELAALLGISQPMVSDYERGELRLHGELIIELTNILDVSSDELLGIKADNKKNGTIKNRRLYRRVQQIDQLPKRDQEALLRTIDAFLSKGN